MSDNILAVPSAYDTPIDFRIGQLPPPIGNLQDAANAISEIYDSIQQIIQAFVLYCGIGPRLASTWDALAGAPQTLLQGNLARFYITAAENIAYGAIISLNYNGTIMTARNANATDNTRIADGFCTTSGGIAAGGVGEVQLLCGIAPISGVIPGQRYWLSTTAGLISNVPATGSGNVEQYLGIGIDSSHFMYISHMWLQH